MVVLLYSLMCLIFGTTFLLIKTGINLGWSPFLFSSLRFIFAGGLLLLFVSRKKTGTVSFQQHIQIAGISLLMTTVPFGALYYGEQYITSGEAAILVSTSPIFILIFNFLLKGKRVLLKETFGALVCILGIVILVMKDFTYSTQFHSVAAKGLIIIAEITFSFGTIQSKAVLEKMAASSKFNALQMLYGGLGLFVLTLITKEKLSIPTNYSGYFILFYFVIVASMVANGIFFLLVKKTNAFFPATWTYVSPVIALILGGIVLQERIGLNGVLGAALVLLGVLLANWQMLEQVLKKTSKEKIKCSQEVIIHENN